MNKQKGGLNLSHELTFTDGMKKKEVETVKGVTVNLCTGEPVTWRYKL